MACITILVENADTMHSRVSITTLGHFLSFLRVILHKFPGNAPNIPKIPLMQQNFMKDSVIRSIRAEIGEKIH